MRSMKSFGMNISVQRSPVFIGICSAIALTSSAVYAAPTQPIVTQEGSALRLNWSGNTGTYVAVDRALNCSSGSTGSCTYSNLYWGAPTNTFLDTDVTTGNNYQYKVHDSSPTNNNGYSAARMLSTTTETGTGDTGADTPFASGSRIQFPTIGYWVIRNKNTNSEICQGSSSNGTTNDYGNVAMQCESLPNGTYTYENLSGSGPQEDGEVIVNVTSDTGTGDTGTDTGTGDTGTDTPFASGSRIQFPTIGYWVIRNKNTNSEICQGSSSNGSTNDYGNVAMQCESLPNGTYTYENLSGSGPQEDGEVIVDGTGGSDIEDTGAIVVVGNSVIRNRSKSAFFFTEQSTPIESIPFGHLNADGEIYGTNNGSLVDGEYKASANNITYTTQWGDNDDDSNASGSTIHSAYDYTPRSNSQAYGIQGDFRIECQWSHFAYDDPIVNHDNKNANQSHLHMYWGNTSVDFSTDLTPGSSNFITKKGGSTCQGGPLNRSSYWMPALMHGDDKVMVPREIIVYYKAREYLDAAEASANGLVTNTLSQIVDMPQGLQLISGNGDRDGAEFPGTDIDERNLNKRVNKWGGIAEKNSDDWTTSPYIAWECGTNGRDVHKFNRIPTQAEWETHCRNQGRTGNPDEDLNATIYFPQCRRPTDEINETNELSSNNFRTHVKHIKPGSGCPSGHVRMPQLGYRIYWDVSELLESSTDALSIDKLRLSSDPSDSDLVFIDRNSSEILEASPEKSVTSRPLLNDTVRRYRAATCDDGEVRVPGGTLHADWVAGWRDSVQKLWLENCSQDGVNCTLGQTGTNLALNGGSMDYPGHAGSIRNENNVIVGSSGSYLIDAPTGSGMNMCTGTAPMSEPETVEPVATPEPVTDLDNDGDGFPASVDCNDDNAQIHPDMNERGRRGRDGIDNDCDGVVD